MASGFSQVVPGDNVRRLRQMAQCADVDGRAAHIPDALLSCHEIERLAAMQHRASRNYFRLLEADRLLRVRTGATPKTVGTILAESMEAERQRLGRELHTGVGQALAGIQIHVSLVTSALPHPSEPVRRSLHQIEQLAAVALEQVRGVSHRLYVPSWQAKPLVVALRDLWVGSGISDKFAATLDLSPLACEPAPEVRRAIYLVAQEGISNAIQHADARHVRMSLRQQAGRITLELADDGSGFRPMPDPEQSRSSAGIGLRSMRDLARQLGGDLQTRSNADGASLIISIPGTHE